MKALIAALFVAWSPPCDAGELQPFQRGSWQALLHEHAGKPLVVHFWGLTCGPCLVELPEWGKLAQERPGADLVMIAADPYPEKPTAITARLVKDGLTNTENWMFDGFSQRLRYEIDPRWQGELPRTVLIDADGSARSIEGVVDLAEIRTWLDKPTKTR